jgi:hypothetical protein
MPGCSRVLVNFHHEDGDVTFVVLMIFEWALDLLTRPQAASAVSNSMPPVVECAQRDCERSTALSG